MSFSNVTANDVVKFFAHRTALPNYGANWQVNFHTADPGLSGVATTNAPTWTGYAPITFSADNTSLTICDDTEPYAPNAAGAGFKTALDFFFPECDVGFVGQQTMTHGSLSVIATGQVIIARPLPDPIIVSALIRPYIPAGAFVFKVRN